MPKKPLAIDASTILATKGSPPPGVSGAVQRSQRPSETLVDLNFKVPAEFRQHFKRLAVEAARQMKKSPAGRLRSGPASQRPSETLVAASCCADLKNVQLLRRAVEAYERDQAR